MEKLTERIGLFDLWAVFFPGAIGVSELLFFVGTTWVVCYKQPFFTMFSVIELSNIAIWVVYILFSLFMGIILQEIGRWLRKKKKSSNITSAFLDPAAGVFTENERASLHSFLSKYGWDGKSTECSNIVFHRINAAAQECGIAEKYVKLSVLQNMSSSLSAAMLIGAIASFVLLIISLVCKRGHIALLLLGSGIVFVFLVVVFLQRSIRFNRYWIRNLIFSMYEKNTKMGKAENEEKRS